MPRPCEPVAVPQLCAVLAHELRSPLSVLQGYIRLLQRGRRDDDPESAMLASMLDATSRLTALARQASDLGACQSAEAGGAAPHVELTVFCDLLGRSAGRHACDVDAALAGAARHPAKVASAASLVAALVAVADAVARIHGTSSSSLQVQIEESADRVRVLVQPAERRVARPGPGAAPPRVPDAFFTLGGVGLSLALASHVLASVAATIKWEDDGSIVLRVPIVAEGAGS